MTRPWECPKCGGQRFMVDETAHDEDGYPVRLRKCLTPRCRGELATEEVPISRGSFWQRAHSRNVARAERAKNQPRRCRWCGGAYMSGFFRQHVRFSAHHQRSIKPPSNGSSREHVRAYQREWTRRRSEAA